MVTRTEKNKKKRNKIKAIETREKNIKALKKFFKITFTTLFILLIISFSIYFTSTYIIKVNEYSKNYSTLPKEFHGYKIVQFGDVYYDNIYSSLFKKTINKINKLKPDIVVFTGNLINKKYNLDDISTEKIINELSNINASEGKYFILGKNDNETVIDIFNKSGFTFLNDESTIIYNNGNTPIQLIGLNNKTNINIDNKLFSIVIINDSNNIDDLLNNISPDIILSGNNINGQIRIPYFGPLINKNKYINSYYNINSTDIYITSGIGTNNYPIRLFNLPSINFFRLKAK